MTFKEALDKLGEIAKSRGEDYYTVYFELNHGNGRIETKCSLYLNGIKDIPAGPTWEAAFDKLDKIINPPAPMTVEEGLGMAPVENIEREA